MIDRYMYTHTHPPEEKRKISETDATGSGADFGFEDTKVAGGGGGFWAAGGRSLGFRVCLGCI